MHDREMREAVVGIYPEMLDRRRLAAQKCAEDAAARKGQFMQSSLRYLHVLTWKAPIVAFVALKRPPDA
jgi:hypothetical protein